MTKFQVGKIYTTGEGADYVWRFLVTKRTAKFITIRQFSHNDFDGRRVMGGPEVRRGVQVEHDLEETEWALPLGSYSMAPVINADRTFVEAS